MTSTKNIIKKIAILVVALLFVVINFSEIETKYACKGVIVETKEQTDVYIISAEYRWWVGLWSKSKGYLILEIPNIGHEYYGHVVNNLTGVTIYKKEYAPDATEPTYKLYGNFSELSGILALKTPIGFFDGKCSLVQE